MLLLCPQWQKQYGKCHAIHLTMIFCIGGKCYDFGGESETCSTNTDNFSSVSNWRSPHNEFIAHISTVTLLVNIFSSRTFDARFEKLRRKSKCMKNTTESNAKCDKCIQYQYLFDLRIQFYTKKQFFLYRLSNCIADDLENWRMSILRFCIGICGNFIVVRADLTNVHSGNSVGAETKFIPIMVYPK